MTSGTQGLGTQRAQVRVVRGHQGAVGSLGRVSRDGTQVTSQGGAGLAPGTLLSVPSGPESLCPARLSVLREVVQGRWGS